VKIYDADSHKNLLANYGGKKKSKSPRDIENRVQA
jgi:hypothetical protein